MRKKHLLTGGGAVVLLIIAATIFQGAIKLPWKIVSSAANAPTSSVPLAPTPTVNPSSAPQPVNIYIVPIGVQQPAIGTDPTVIPIPGKAAIVVPTPKPIPTASVNTKATPSPELRYFVRPRK